MNPIFQPWESKSFDPQTDKVNSHILQSYQGLRREFVPLNTQRYAAMRANTIKHLAMHTGCRPAALQGMGCRSRLTGKKNAGRAS